MGLFKKVSKFLRRVTRGARKNLGRATRNARKIFRGGNPNVGGVPNAAPAPNATVPAPVPVPPTVPVPVPAAVPVPKPVRRKRRKAKTGLRRVRNTFRRIGKGVRNALTRTFTKKRS